MSELNFRVTSCGLTESKPKDISKVYGHFVLIGGINSEVRLGNISCFFYITLHIVHDLKALELLHRKEGLLFALLFLGCVDYIFLVFHVKM